MLKLKQNKGITLIALIITIIVMLILVTVTVTVALNGGLFAKAEEAGIKTKISQIQDALIVKKTEKMAEKQGVVKEYNLKIEDLELPQKIEDEFSNKLIIGTDGNLYYDETIVTDTEEQNIFKEMGINKYVKIENNWEKRGLTSANVMYDKLYVSEDLGLTFMINSDGSFEANWGRLFFKR